MSNVDIPMTVNVTTNDTPDRFPSLDSLRDAHGDLLQRRHDSGDTPEFWAEIASFIRRGQATGVLLDFNQDRRAGQSLLNYWANTLYRAGREPPNAVLATFDPLLAPILPDEACPYLGLDAFEEENRDVFFGRQELVKKMTERLKETRLLAVVGPSGSGKSSVVLAGLLPALKDGAVPGSQDWHYCPPMVPGSNPLANLARLFRPADVDAAEWEQDQIERFREDSGHLARLIGELREPAVLVIDQFEELFTLCPKDDVRQAFIDNLLGLIQSPEAGHTVILTMRVDFFKKYMPKLQAFQPFLKVGRVNVPHLGFAELREAIEKPAEMVGLKFEQGVVDALLDDIFGEPAALPLLQFTLRRLWKDLDRNRITRKAYDYLGGAHNALAHSANTFYDGLIPEQQKTAKRILLQMALISEELEVTSKRIRRENLYQAGEARYRVDGVLEKLVEERLVRLREGDTPDDDQVEVAHESLVRNWDRLGEWLDDERENMRRRLRLRAMAEQWDADGRVSEDLLRGARLQEALDYQDLNDLEEAFVQASQEDVDATHRRELGRLRRFLIVLAVISLVALGAATFGFYKQYQYKLESRVATSHRLAIQAGSNLEDRLDLALLLSLEAYQAAETLEARNSLLAGLVHYPHFATLRGHTSSVSGVAFRPVLRAPPGFVPTLASASWDGTIMLWDVATGEPIGEPLKGHTGRVFGVAFSPDGGILASGGLDDTIRLWSVPTGQPIGQPLTGHTADVYSVAFSPDGKILASGSRDGTIILWNVSTVLNTGVVTTSQPLSQSFTGHTSLVWSIAFSPNGQMLASGSCRRSETGRSCEQGEIRLWDVATGEPIGELLTVHSSSVRSVAFNPLDGRTLASGSCGESETGRCEQSEIQLWDVATGEPIGDPLTGHTALIYDIAFSPDGKTLVSGSADNTIILWDVESGQPIGQSLTGHTADVYKVAFSPDGQRLASGSADKTVVLWDVTARRRVDQLLTKHSGSVSSVAFRPDGQVLASGSFDGSVILWDVATGEPIGDPLAGHDRYVFSVAFSPDGQKLASGGKDKMIILWDVETGQPIGQPFAGHTKEVRSVAFSPDGQKLASGGYDNTIILWDVATGQPICQPLIGHTEGVRSVAFSPDGQVLASGSHDDTVILWDVVTDQPIGQPLIGHINAVYSLAFSPDGQMLASAGKDETVILWDVAFGQPIGQPFVGHTASVYNLAFSPDGQVLASSSRDGTVILWDVATGQPIVQTPAGATSVYSVAFSPNSPLLLASGSRDSTVVLWNFNWDSWPTLACEIAARNLDSKEWRQYLPGQEYRETCEQ